MTRSLLKKTLVAAAAAAVIGAGIVVAAPENPANDCLVGLQNADSVTITTDQTCNDGDPTCDADGAADGTCTFHIRGCVNLPGVSGCELRPIKKVKFVAPHSKDKVVVTPIAGQASSVCGSFIDFHVPLKKKGTKPGKRKIIASVTADVKPRGQNKDKDKITFNCNPGTGGSTTTTTLPGGTECPANPQGGPDQLTVTVGSTGNDLDTGFSGQSHNFLNVSGGSLKYCLTGCDASTNSTCQASGSTGANSLNGPTFGPPLPLFSAGVAVCVVNRFQDPMIQAVVDVATGGFDATSTNPDRRLKLLSDTYQGSSNQVCPKCVSGKCDSGRNQGQNCTVDGTVVVNNPPNVNNVTYNVSKSCLPSQATLLGTPNVVLPLTTGTSTLAGNAAGNFPCPGQNKHDECGAGSCTVDCSAKPDAKGGINQTCCSTGAGLPCFPTDPNEAAGQMSRTGVPANLTPAWPDPNYPKTGPGTLAATFCIPATGSTTVDATAGLAGPGAVLVAGTSTYSKAP